MMQNSEVIHTQHLRSLSGADWNHANSDQEEVKTATHNDDAGIHHSDEDFDRLIQEDEARALNDAKNKGDVDMRTIDGTSSEIIDINNVHFAPETDSEQVINFHDDNNIHIPTSSSQGSLSDNASATPISPSSSIDWKTDQHTIGHAHSQSHLHATDVFGALAIVAALAVIVIFCRSIFLRRRARRKLGKEVFMYILDFDVEDVDLTRAATGGWHGTYKNNLREGIETDPDTDDDFFSDEEVDDDSDNDDDDAFFDASRRSRESHDNMIVFMEEGEDLLVGDKNIYFEGPEVDDDDIYYTSDDDLFSPVRT